jgi:2-C-methyl-D-erythritol 4-phosphate cytidylyltransferase
VCWSIAAAQAAGIVEIVVVAAPARVDAVAGAVRPRYAGVRVIAGGETRTASSWAALDATAAAVIAIHDAARPFASPSLFQRCIETAMKEGGAVAGMPLADTIRRADEAGVSVEEIERDGLWQVQTPQAFRRELLERARAAAGTRSFTDDAAAVIAAGGRPRMVVGEPRNLKITTSEDLAYARELVAKGLVAIAASTASPRALPR